MDLNISSFNTTKVASSPSSLEGVLSDVVYWRVLSVALGLDITVGVFATGANIVTIIVYSKLGFSESTNISLTALAVSDLGIAVTLVVTAIGMLLPAVFDVPFSDDIFLTTTTYPHYLLSRISAMITTYLSIERYFCVLLPLKVKTVITSKRTLVVMVIIFSFTFCLYPNGLLRFGIGWTFDVKRNRTVLGVIPTTNPIVLRLHNVNLLIVSVILPFVTFFLVVLCTILLSVSLKKSKLWRNANRYTPPYTADGSRSEDSTGKSEAPKKSQSKEARAVKMVITIAAVFIVTSIPSCMHIIAVMLVPGFTAVGRYYRIFDVGGAIYFGVNAINSGANVIIYYKMSYKFRSAMIALFVQNKEKRSGNAVRNRLKLKGGYQ